MYACMHNIKIINIHTQEATAATPLGPVPHAIPTFGQRPYFCSMPINHNLLACQIANQAFLLSLGTVYHHFNPCFGRNILDLLIRRTHPGLLGCRQGVGPALQTYSTHPGGAAWGLSSNSG